MCVLVDWCVVVTSGALSRAHATRDKATGKLKGDALVTYLREPSVDLAIQLLDGAPFRPTMAVNMTVSKARFEMKGEVYQPKAKPNKNNRKVGKSEAACCVL